VNWTPNTTDGEGRRYRFGAQPQVAYWNLGQLANALGPLFASTAPLYAGLERYVATYEQAERANVAAKLGFADCNNEDAELIDQVYALMQSAEVDMTLFFRALCDVELDAPGLAPFADAFYDEAKRRDAESAFVDWLTRYARRARHDGTPAPARRARMRAVNPRYVLRNYLAQQAIDRAEQGDTAGIGELLDVLRRPYDDQPGRERFAERRPDWARQKAGCSMLSCSS
jgi:uncharacterized protein YdiU (UPF0061 family)